MLVFGSPIQWRSFNPNSGAILIKKFSWKTFKFPWSDWLFFWIVSKNNVFYAISWKITFKSKINAKIETYLLYNEPLTGRELIFVNWWNCKKRNIWEKRGNSNPLRGNINIKQDIEQIKVIWKIQKEHWNLKNLEEEKKILKYESWDMKFLSKPYRWQRWRWKNRKKKKKI
jgi:hypothetical protein